MKEEADTGSCDCVVMVMVEWDMFWEEEDGSGKIRTGSFPGSKSL